LGGFFILCGSLRISAFSALKGFINAENAEIRRESQRSSGKTWTR